MCKQLGQLTLDEMLGSLRTYLSRFLRSSGRHVSNSRFDTSDVIQESLIQIWSECQQSCLSSNDESLPRDATGNEPVQSFSFARLRRIALGHLSKQFRFHGAEKRAVRRESGLSSSSVLEDDRVSSEICELRELYAEFMVNLNLLEDIPQAVVFRRIFKDESFNTISKELDMTIYAVRTIYKKAIGQLKTKLVGGAV